MRIQQVDLRDKIKSIKAKQALQNQSAARKEQVVKTLSQVPQIQVENQSSSTFLNDDLQKTLEIINQMKNYSSNSLNGKEIEQKVVLSSDKSQVLDILLVKPGKKAMKRSMKRFLKKRAMQKKIMPNLFNVSQTFMDLLLFQNDYIEKRISYSVMINNLLAQAESIFLEEEAVEQQLMKREKQEQEITIYIQKTIENLSNLQRQFSFLVQEPCRVAESVIFEQDFIPQKKQQGNFDAKKKGLKNSTQLHFNERQMQEQDMKTNIKKINEPQQFRKLVEITMSKKVFIPNKKHQRLLEVNDAKNSNAYEKQSEIHVKELIYSKVKTQNTTQVLNQQLILEYQHNRSIPYQHNNQEQYNIICQEMIEKVREQVIVVGKESQIGQQFNNQEEILETNQIIEQNKFTKILNDEILQQDQLKYQKQHNQKTQQFGQFLVGQYKNSVKLIYSKKKKGQLKQLQKEHLNIQQLLQQLKCQNKIKTNLIKISDLQISITLTQAQRNTLLNLIKQNKITQIQTLIMKIIFKQCHSFKQNTVLSNMLVSNNNTPQFQVNKVNLSKQNYIAKNLFSQQMQPVKQLQRVNQQVSGFAANYSNIFNQYKLLGGGCGISKIAIDPNVLKEDDQQKLKSDKFFNESKYADESQFGDFIEIYNKYYTNTEINHEVLENRIRIIVEALHKQCEHIFSLTIRSKVIELINLLINYYMIAIQKNDIQTLQKFIDKTDQELKDLKETCFQNRKKYPCFDLCQYFDILISLNQQRQGIDKINENQAIKIAEMILKLIKFGAGFTSIFGAIDTLSKIKLDDIQKHFKEMQLACSQLFQSSQEIGQQSLEQYTSYSSGNLSKKIQAIWLRKVQSLGDEISDEHQQIIFYLKEINEIQNNGNSEIVLFVYMQINYLLQKKQKDDNLNSFTNLLKDTKQEHLILDFINYLQLKTYSTTLFESAKKLLDSLITSEQFRQLKISLLLKFSQILENLNDKKLEYNKLMIHLCMTYLQENEISVKIIYKGNQQMKIFIQDIEKYTAEIVKESKQSYQTMKSMIQDEEQLNKIANKIDSKEDVAILLAKTYVQMWEASVKQRQEQKQIAHKDDTLLEVVQLYIKQKVTHLQGHSLFVNFNEQNQDNQLEVNDALRLIINKFLIPNFVQPKNKYQTPNLNKSDQQTCKILSILAEGGSGKSMILKKLELELLKDDSEYIKDERAEYIPFIIKCNSLDINQPSIEEYLLSQNLSQSEIELLKRSERNKLIMLDGYDEYTGDYFKVYQKLKINNWVNTLVIVTSRLEKISVSDAKLYFNYYDKQGNQGSQDSFSILKLEKINDSDIKEYLERYKEQQLNQSNFNEQKHNQFLEIIFQSQARQFLEMLKLPINLYLTTRMVADLDLNDKKTLTTIQEASDQVEIQELFFQQQFLKLSQTLVEQKLQIPANAIESENQKQELIKTVQSCYFEYFQTIAILMFLQKGKKANFQSTKKSDIIFKLRDEVTKYFNQNQINSEEVIQQVKGYIDSRVITRIQLSIKEENSQNQSELDALNDESLEFEFRHKSLFEYFTARAMKYDFDLHKETIFKLDSSQLREFSINKKIIMSSEINASEQQILLKLFKLIKPEIDSPQFKENYYFEDISKTNRYIQFLKKSSISNYLQTSEIDVGSSNLLSALFISKFSFPNLVFKNCSFSQAYIQKYSRKVVEFQDCNFGNALLEKQHLQYFETSNTKNVIQTAFQQNFNTDDIFSFNQVMFYKNNLVTITKTGFINLFEVLPNKSQNFKRLLTNQITLSPLNSIHINETKNVFVATAKKSLFEVNPQTLEKVNSFTFSKEISSLSINKSKYIVTLSNNQIVQGDIENGFKTIDQNKIQADYSILKNDFIITSQRNQIDIYNLQDLQIIKTNLDPNCRLQTSAFSADGKYLVTGSRDNTCKIWNLEKGFELINTIEGHTDSIQSVAFSTDGKYLATGSRDKTCKIWCVEKEFELINTIQGHTNSITSVAFSADGKYLATGSFDKTCKIWNVERGFELINKIEGHTDYIKSVAFSAQGKYLATGSRDSTCKIWNVEKGFELIYTIQGHYNSINSIAFSADGKYLATGSSDSTCKIWNVEKGFELIKTIQGHTNSIQSVAFSADGKYLSTSSQDDTCKIWNVEKGFKLINTIQEHTQSINSVAFSANGKYLATGSDDYTCKIWNVEKGFELLNTIKGHTNSIYSVAFSADGKYLATGSFDKTCKIWNVERGFELINTIQGHSYSIYSVAFSADGKYLATGSRDSTCKIWNIEKGFELINTIQGHTQSINSVTFSSDGKYLTIGSDDYTCKIWNVEKGFELINTIQGHTNSINSVAFSADGKYLATSSKDKTCKIWYVKKGFELLNTIQGHNQSIHSVAFSADGKYLATGSYDYTCKIWNVEKGFEHINTIEGHTDSIQSVAFSTDGKYLATGSRDKTCKIWCVEKGFELINTIQGFTNSINSVAFSANVKYLATGSDDQICRIWNVEKGFQLINTVEGHTQSINSVAFSADGKYFATGSYDYTCKIWNVEKGFELINTIHGLTYSINSVAFSADGKNLATCSDDQTCKIWSVEKGFELLNTIQGHTQSINSVAFSADGKYIATGSSDNTCKIWNVVKELEFTNTIQGHEHFYTQFYEINDQGAQKLSTAIAKCTNLKNLTLCLGDNEIGFQGSSALGSALINCSKLTNLTLDLDYNQIGAQGSQALLLPLENCINLTNLTIKLINNKIGEQGSHFLGVALAKCKYLVNLALGLSQNQIGSQGVSVLSSNLAKCSNLTNLTLDLSDNKIDAQGGLNLGSALTNLINLIHFTINLGYNYIGPQGASALGSALANHNNLTNLTILLCQNQICAQGASALGSALVKSTKITNLFLDMSENQIGDQGASALSSALVNCTNLKFLKLKLSENQISAQGASSLGLALANCNNLTHLTLELQYNQIGLQGLSALASGIANCTNLTNLIIDLYYNQIGLKGVTALGSALVNCANLTSLTIKLLQNQIGFQGIIALNSALSNCTSLRNLALELPSKLIDESQRLKIKSKFLKFKRLFDLKIKYQ